MVYTCNIKKLKEVEKLGRNEIISLAKITRDKLL